MSNEEYLTKSFKEVKVGLAPEHTQSLDRNIQEERWQEEMTVKRMRALYVHWTGAGVPVCCRVPNKADSYSM